MNSSPVPSQGSSLPISKAKKKNAKLTLWPLIVATFFMVSGGTYGTEEIIHGAGYGRGILIVLLLPIFWALPTAFMIGELSSALPAEGGYYEWVRRGLGNFWGFQEAWQSLAASVFDMAIYPTLFLFYLKQMSPWFSTGHHAVIAELILVVTVTALNLAGVRAVGLTSVWLFALLSLPFAIIVVLAPFKAGAFGDPHASSTVTELGLLGGVLVAIWNYTGWDNASTIAQEVDEPQKTYPKAMMGAVALVSLSYVLPFLGAYFMGFPSESFSRDGSWAEVAGQLGGKWRGFEWLRFMVVIGGMMCAFGMLNALVLSYSRLPLAMARDGMLPKVFGKMSSKTKVPWVSVLACAACWGLCLQLGFKRLITLDIVLSGGSLMLEFAALVALRIREPNLKRSFRVPGGLAGAILVGVCPLLLLMLAVVESDKETVMGINGLLFGAMIIVLGFVLYWATKPLRHSLVAPVATENAATSD